MGLVSVIVKEAGEKIKDITPGTMLTKIALMEMLEANEKQYTSRVESLKKYLKNEHGIFLGSVRGIGYRIAAPGDEIDICEGRIVKGKHIIESSVKDMNKIHIDKITDKDKLGKTIQKSQESANLVLMLKLGQQKEKALT